METAPTTTYSAVDPPKNPHRHEGERRKWASGGDFICACIGNAFRLDVYPGFLIFLRVGIVALVPCLCYMMILFVPMLLMQSFLGQFSSSGFISVFRMSPLFKGIGYASLAVNLISVTYYIVFGAVPLFYFFNSFRQTLPWNCDNSTTNQTDVICDTGNETFDGNQSLPSVEFLRSELGLHGNESFTFSWLIFLCGTLIWLVVGLILCTKAKTIGKFVRYSVVVLFWVMFICLGRFMCLEGAWIGVYSRIFDPEIHGEAWFYSPFIIITAFGPGWGSIISLSSYNHFKSNISRSSWFICAGQLASSAMLGLLMFLVVNHFKEVNEPDNLETFYIGNNWMKLLWAASALLSLDYPNMWSMFFFGMLTLAAIVLLVVQLFAILTAVFDEFEQLRLHQRKVVPGLVTVLALASIIFYTNIGFEFERLLAVCVLLTQALLNVLLVVVVLWIYGRERFQRDFTFMTDQVFATWKVYVVRFVIPIITILLGLCLYVRSIKEIDYMEGLLVASLIVFLLWLLVPLYSGCTIFKTTGTFGMRIKECAKPKKWYPAEATDRQKYEDASGITEFDTAGYLTQTSV